eukprot:m51a1_g11642 hypothetical protein (676) ;mRNA; f:4827-13089
MRPSRKQRDSGLGVAVGRRVVVSKRGRALRPGAEQVVALQLQEGVFGVLRVTAPAGSSPCSPTSSTASATARPPLRRPQLLKAADLLREDTEAYPGGDAAVDPLLGTLLGTQGWRRFAFRDLGAVVPRSEGDRARSVLAYDERQGLAVTLAAPPRMFKADRAMGCQRTADGRPRVRVSAGVDTVYWASNVAAPSSPVFTAKFRVGDQVTSFRVMADAISETRSGTLGTGDLLIESKRPFFVSPKIPLFVTAGDVARIPVAIVNDLVAQDVTLSAKIRARRLVEVAVQGPTGTVELAVDARAGANSDMVRANLTIEARGFPVALNHGGTLESGKASTFEVEIPTSALGRVRTSAKVYATPVANLVQALEALVREPFGCFEQASSTTYPATMALQYMKTHQGVPEELVRRAGDVVDKGYKKLVAFETRGGGFEWFGQAPAHEALTAYGLLEFLDMSKVYPVDEALLRRTREYLLGQRLPGGGFRRNSRSLDSFGAAPDSVTNAYILWSMTFAGVREGLDEQIESAVALCETDDDPYLVGLVAGTLLNVGDTARGVRLAGRVAKHLQPSGEAARPLELPAFGDLLRRGGKHVVEVRAACAAGLTLVLDNPENQNKNNVVMATLGFLYFSSPSKYFHCNNVMSMPEVPEVFTISWAKRSFLKQFKVEMTYLNSMLTDIT